MRRIVGTTDEITTCDECGREGLSHTVVIDHLDADGNLQGELNYYGSECATKVNLGGVKFTARKIMQAAAAADMKRAFALQQSKEMMAFFDEAMKEGRGPVANFNRAATAYIMANAYFWDRDRELGEAAMLASLAYHATVVETNGLAAL